MAGVSRACAGSSRNRRGSCLSYLRSVGLGPPAAAGSGRTAGRDRNRTRHHLAVLANAIQGGGSEACLLIVAGLNCPAIAPQRAIRAFLDLSASLGRYP